MQRATVFNVQKFSLNDGPGIRTVVFLKGCPLHCAWCANPESQSALPQLEWKESACIGCGACLAAAPGARARETSGKRHVDVRNLRGDSDEGRAAVSACPTRALTCTGKMTTTDEVLRACLQDKPFYEESGGGVTLSGGEALLRPDFCEELLVRLHEEDVDTCIETEAHVSPDVFQRIATHLDHMLVDLKHVDAARLLKHTGGKADLMLDNLRWALANHPDVTPRTPVIPGFNDRLEDAHAMARWLREAGGTRVQLLPFHNFGESKYDLLDIDYSLRGVPNLHPVDLRDYQRAYRNEGIDAFF
ncbi:MAG: glycyl-radical enzyme activating protein [Olsenella sp.]|jgi:pyruvate formate lyase activating enzyme|nr:glycyl-radical enzyme activating protein [Olsenella sp.]MCI1289342.1 glycyl-radical enzyme activating protein [Olsenella sp.]